MGLLKFKGCVELQCESRFPLKLKGVVYRSYVRRTTLYESKVWCFNENDMKILRRTDGSMVRTMC